VTAATTVTATTVTSGTITNIGSVIGSTGSTITGPNINSVTSGGTGSGTTKPIPSIGIDSSISPAGASRDTTFVPSKPAPTVNVALQADLLQVHINQMDASRPVDIRRSTSELRITKSVVNTEGIVEAKSIELGSSGIVTLDVKK
jgi:hypothetical protein